MPNCLLICQELYEHSTMQIWLRTHCGHMKNTKLKMSTINSYVLIIYYIIVIVPFTLGIINYSFNFSCKTNLFYSEDR